MPGETMSEEQGTPIAPDLKPPSTPSPSVPAPPPPTTAYRVLGWCSRQIAQIRERFGFLEILASIIVGLGLWLFSRLDSTRDEMRSQIAELKLSQAAVPGLISERMAAERKDSAAEAEATKRTLHHYQSCARAVSLLHSQRCASGSLADSLNQLAVLYNEIPVREIPPEIKAQL